MRDDPLIELVAAVGEASFPGRTLDFLNSHVVVDHLALFVYDASLVPHVVGAASRGAGRIATDAGHLYERAMFHRFDPNSERVRSGSGEEDVMVYRLAASDIRDAAYRSDIYGRFGILERVSLIRRVLGRWLLLNLYRDRATGKFNAASMGKLTELAPLLVACAGKHLLLTVKDSQSRSTFSFDSLLGSLDVELSQRERQVCAHALAGLTVAGIASVLEIKESTVATLRRRAYAKLGISNLNSLFAVCLRSRGS